MIMENSTAIKGCEYAAQAIDKIARETPNASARKAIAGGVLAFGNYTDAAKVLWFEYLNRGCPRRA